MSSESTIDTQWDVIIIGGGAAGFFSALTVAEQSPKKLRIAILEKSGQVLNKVKISGGGRCNVTHDCLEPKILTKNYPRGERSLIGPFNHFGPTDTIAWFTKKGVELKVEKDGRMFPTTDDSQTIIDCFHQSAEDYGIEIHTQTGVSELQREGEKYEIILEDKTLLYATHVLIATGGTRLAAGAQFASNIGHSLIPPVPSLFTFTINHPLIDGLEGLSVSSAEVQIPEYKLKNRGPLLITHWGVSGPGVLKLSALGARDLADSEYQFTLHVNWCPEVDIQKLFQLKRKEWGKRQVITRSPFASIPKRLWEKICHEAKLPDDLTWSRLGKEHTKKLDDVLINTRLPVTGKSLNKDEFVTCGGVELKEVNLKTMESKLSPQLYFAGEVLNIDGVTGGFNFQNAWTTAYLAGRQITSFYSI